MWASGSKVQVLIDAHAHQKPPFPIYSLKDFGIQKPVILENCNYTLLLIVTSATFPEVTQFQVLSKVAREPSLPC